MSWGMLMAEDQKELDEMFAAARRERMPAALADRMVADAAQVQAGRAKAARVKPKRRPAIWAQLREALGGWTGMGGLATACAAGLWVGLAPPAFMPDPAQLVYESEQEPDLFGGTDLALLLAEGN
ncbi:hypothetical protein ACFORG_18550 [Lutimaribacter marinistellae]|uniref:Dihydroorotate dehydrogenase n=1 Tax=Lutimaribacter marinistellae TaxID=1820329 RepID=A0ABV7TPI4_9RHOB